MKRELAAALAAAGMVALTAVAAVATSNHLTGRGDERPVVTNVYPPSTPPGPPVPQKRPGYPIERLEQLREAKR